MEFLNARFEPDVESLDDVEAVMGRVELFIQCIQKTRRSEQIAGVGQLPAPGNKVYVSAERGARAI